MKRCNNLQGQRSTHLQKLQSHQSEALLLEALDDVSDQASLDAVRFDGNEGALGFGSHSSERHNNITFIQTSGHLKDVFSTDEATGGQTHGSHRCLITLNMHSSAKQGYTRHALIFTSVLKFVFSYFNTQEAYLIIPM